MPLKNKEKKNIKAKGDGNAKQSSGPSSLVAVEEINATFDEINILALCLGW